MKKERRRKEEKKMGREGEEERKRLRERKISQSTTEKAKSGTRRIIRKVICRLSFISRAGLISICLCLNETSN